MLLRYARNAFSQNGEDGIVAEILRRLNIDRGLAFECGAWDGMHLSNTYALSLGSPGFKVIAVEGDRDRYADLLRTADRNSNIIPVNAWLSKDEDTIGDILKKHDATELVIMSIDIDSHDYQAWKNLSPDIRPLVVVIEINSSFPPGIEKVYPEIEGSTFTSTLKLGRSKGYTLVAHTGNMIFVRDDVVERVNVDVSDPDSMFVTNWLPIS
jgi:hypothetical protein